MLLLHSFCYYCTLFWYYCTLFGIIAHFFAIIAHFFAIIAHFFAIIQHFIAIIAHFFAIIALFLLLLPTFLLLLHTFLLLLHGLFSGCQPKFYTNVHACIEVSIKKRIRYSMRARALTYKRSTPRIQCEALYIAFQNISLCLTIVLDCND